jgi:hypothetical protein
MSLMMRRWRPLDLLAVEPVRRIRARPMARHHRRSHYLAVITATDRVAWLAQVEGPPPVADLLIFRKRLPGEEPSTAQRRRETKRRRRSLGARLMARFGGATDIGILAAWRSHHLQWLRRTQWLRRASSSGEPPGSQLLSQEELLDLARGAEGCSRNDAGEPAPASSRAMPSPGGEGDLSRRAHRPFPAPDLTARRCRPVDAYP